MIKLGSRTELIVPAEDGLEVKVRVGQKVKAGETMVAEYQERTQNSGLLVLDET